MQVNEQILNSHDFIYPTRDYLEIKCQSNVYFEGFIEVRSGYLKIDHRVPMVLLGKAELCNLKYIFYNGLKILT